MKKVNISSDKEMSSKFKSQSSLTLESPKSLMTIAHLVTRKFTGASERNLSMDCLDNMLFWVLLDFFKKSLIKRFSSRFIFKQTKKYLERQEKHCQRDEEA